MPVTPGWIFRLKPFDPPTHRGKEDGNSGVPHNAMLNGVACTWLGIELVTPVTCTGTWPVFGMFTATRVPPAGTFIGPPEPMTGPQVICAETDWTRIVLDTEPPRDGAL